MVLAATGTVIGFEDQVSSLLDKITRPNQAHATPVPPRHEQQGLIQPASAQLSPDQAAAIACSRLPGAKPYRVQMPQYGGRYVVNLVDVDNRITGGRNSVAIDPRSGNIISESLSSELTHTERLMAWNGAIHEGNAFGLPGRIIAVLASILLPMQALSGLIMWLRRPKIAHSQLIEGTHR